MPKDHYVELVDAVVAAYARSDPFAKRPPSLAAPPTNEERFDALPALLRFGRAHQLLADAVKRRPIVCKAVSTRQSAYGRAQGA